ncbi:Phycobilisome protein [Rippkaea orientalis PCC 8801]|uniref:Phycobilisome protein n=1 Tax=Rippkaea orientalis (strain PCC 8801 / RF-1) TaxID=41431 RepID=B7K2Z2_RIPO1|nr:phycobilisome protein [Rippkaea orientalis]ACK67693.1 Phycobilisome protein [Rippkaea orientalis PCC 8801]
MLTNLREFVANKIEDRGQFISSKQLTDLEKYYKQEQIRLASLATLLNKISQLTKESVDVIHQKYLLSFGYDSDDNIKLVSNIIDSFLKDIALSMLAGDPSILDKYRLNEFHEYLKSVNHSATWYAEALKNIKEDHGLQNEANKELHTYIDYLISALSQKEVEH